LSGVILSAGRLDSWRLNSYKAREESSAEKPYFYHGINCANITNYLRPVTAATFFFKAPKSHIFNFNEFAQVQNNYYEEPTL
jgi:hypothetical protein